MKLFREAPPPGALATSLDLNWDPKWGQALTEKSSIARGPFANNCCPLVDLAHGNRARKLCAFADAPDLMCALQKLCGWGAGAVVVHNGTEGAGVFFARDDSRQRPPVVVKKPVNGQPGTGDCCLSVLHASASMIRTDRRAFWRSFDLPTRSWENSWKGGRELLPSLE